jgi:hypothetical protein
MTVLPRYKVFFVKNIKIHVYFFLLTRSQNITKSQNLIFFSNLLSFFLFFGRLERRSTGGGVAGQNCIKATRSAPHCLCATAKFSNFENFVADLKIFENFIANSIFFQKTSRRFAIFDGKLTHDAPFSVSVAYWVVRYG